VSSERYLFVGNIRPDFSSSSMDNGICWITSSWNEYQYDVITSEVAALHKTQRKFTSIRDTAVSDGDLRHCTAPRRHETLHCNIDPNFENAEICWL
jgi:hypothetical protein